MGKNSKISKHHLPLSCKNKGNQPPLNHNNSVELKPSNTKKIGSSIHNFPLQKSIFTLQRFYSQQDWYIQNPPFIHLTIKFTIGSHVLP